MNEEELLKKLNKAQDILQYRFKNESLLQAALTHPSAVEKDVASRSYERLEFLGDSILGALVATKAFQSYEDLDEGGLTRIKVALVSGSNLSDLAQNLGLAEVIIFGSSEMGTGGRGLHSALENVYEACVAALFLDGGIEQAREFVERTLIPHMDKTMADVPENPKSALQEKLQEGGITPTYKVIETQGPPHDRTFTVQVFAGSKGLAQGTGRTKKDAESQAARSTLAKLGDMFGLNLDSAPKKKNKSGKSGELSDKQRLKQEQKQKREEEKQKREEEKLEQKQRREEEKQEQKQRREEERKNEKRDGLQIGPFNIGGSKKEEDGQQTGETPASESTSFWASEEIPEASYAPIDDDFDENDFDEAPDEADVSNQKGSA